MTKYKKLMNGEGFELIPGKEIMKFACCDCGLVHDIAVAIEDNGKVGLAFKRNKRATGQLRRHNFGYLQQ